MKDLISIISKFIDFDNPDSSLIQKNKLFHNKFSEVIIIILFSY